MPSMRRYVQRSLVAALLLAVATASVGPGAGPGRDGDGGRTASAPGAALRWSLRSTDQVPPVAVAGPALPPPASTSAPILAPVPATLSVRGIPPRALEAYSTATDRLRTEQPGCRLPWPLLAAIGYVESAHGTVQGGSITADGLAVPPILGPRLDGTGEFALIRDTDGGALDADSRFDRAVGPMQFIPSTWARSGADGDGDGRRDPQDLDDAALAAGRYLCAGGYRIDRPTGTIAAVFSYNHSYDYVRVVLTVAARYAGQSPAKWGVGLLPAPSASPSPSPSASPSPSPSPASPSFSPSAAKNAPSPSPAPVSPRPLSSTSPTPSPEASPLATPVPAPSKPVLPLDPSSPTPAP